MRRCGLRIALLVGVVVFALASCAWGASTTRPEASSMHGRTLAKLRAADRIDVKVTRQRGRSETLRTDALDLRIEAAELAVGRDPQGNESDETDGTDDVDEPVEGELARSDDENEDDEACDEVCDLNAQADALDERATNIESASDQAAAKASAMRKKAAAMLDATADRAARAALANAATLRAKATRLRDTAATQRVDAITDVGVDTELVDSASALVAKAAALDRRAEAQDRRANAALR